MLLHIQESNVTESNNVSGSVRKDTLVCLVYLLELVIAIFLCAFFMIVIVICGTIGIMITMLVSAGIEHIMASNDK